MVMRFSPHYPTAWHSTATPFEADDKNGADDDDDNGDGGDHDNDVSAAAVVASDLPHLFKKLLLPVKTMKQKKIKNTKKELYQEKEKKNATFNRAHRP